MKILINTDWLKFIKDLSPEKQNEIMLAILDYPNRDCSLSCWAVIRPELEKGQISYFNRLKSLKQNNPVTVPSRVPSRSKDGDIDKDKDINKDNKGGVGEKEKFIAPTIEEVIEYAQSRKCTEETAQKFFDYYSTQGWKDSKGQKVKNWKGKFIAIWDKPENHETPFYI